jgi:hypothetical protein
MNIYQQLIVIAGATVGGGLAGWLVAIWRTHANPTAVETSPAVQGTPTDEWIDQAAGRWASARGRPEAQGLIASKLRLGYTLQERRAARRRWP